ncbi:Hypothetical protein MVR_LOCUS216 [uncultured virus]|nr:Hypothetical protein MVR_LOCUS216 [uncultured virus]
MGKTDKKVSSKGSSAASSKTPTKSKTPSSENSPSGAGSTSAVLRYKDIKFTNVEASDMNREKQPLSYIKHNGARLLVQADWINLEYHGIPLLANDEHPDRYHKDDSTRGFIKIPLDPKQKACRELRAHLEAADKWAQSSTLKKKLFGDKAKDHNYMSLIKTPEPIEESKKKPGKDYPIIDYVKMRFHTEFPSGVMATRLNRVDKDKKRTPITVETVTDIANDVGYKSNIKFVFYYPKIWADKTKQNGANFYRYSLSLKVMVIDFEPNEKMGGGGGDVDCLDSDDEGAGVTATVTQKLADSDEEGSNSEASDPSEQSDDEEPPKASPKKPESKSKSKSKAKPESDDEGSADDSEEVPPKSSPKKPDPKSKSKAKAESEDDESEEEKPKSPSKSKGKSSKTKKPKKSKKVDSDDEDSGEEIKSVKKRGRK